MDSFAWARVLEDLSAIGAMTDAEFDEFWTSLGKALRVATVVTYRQTEE